MLVSLVALPLPYYFTSLPLFGLILVAEEEGAPKAVYGEEYTLRGSDHWADDPEEFCLLQGEARPSQRSRIGSPEAYAPPYHVKIKGHWIP